MLRLSDTYVRITDTCNVCIYCYCTFIVTLEMHNFHTCFSASCCCIFSLPIVEFAEHQQQQQKHWFKTAESAKLYLVAWQWTTGSTRIDVDTFKCNSIKFLNMHLLQTNHIHFTKNKEEEHELKQKQKKRKKRRSQHLLIKFLPEWENNVCCELYAKRKDFLHHLSVKHGLRKHLIYVYCVYYRVYCTYIPTFNACWLNGSSNKCVSHTHLQK